MQKRKFSTRPSDSIDIKTLPKKIDSRNAVDIAYNAEIEWIEKKLRQGISVLVSCEKILIPCLFDILVGRLSRNRETPFRCVAVSAATSRESTGLHENASYAEILMSNFKKVVLESTPDTILFLANLDVFITRQEGRFIREITAWLYEYPQVTTLAFHEHDVIPPDILNNIFTARQEIFGIKRESLVRLITQEEAKRMDPFRLNLVRLYKYVSGINAVRLRKIFSSFLQHPEFVYPGDDAKIYGALRDMTSGSFRLSDIDMEKDIAGYTQVKRILKDEIVDLCKRMDGLGGKMVLQQEDSFVPKGILFSGPPGTGKISMAKALASASNAAFTVVSSAELKSEWEIDGKERLRRIFSQARKTAPSMVILDKLDAFASARSTCQPNCIEYSMLMQLIAEMDSIRPEEIVFVVGTTDLLSLIDPALFRPGRFELHISFPYPNKNDRREIIELYKKKFSLPLTSWQIDEIAQRTGGYLSVEDGIKFSGDYLHSLARFLKRRFVLNGEKGIQEQDIHDAMAKTGKYDYRGQVSQEDRWRIAVHEAGHCLISRVLQYVEEINSISIAAGDIYAPEYSLSEIKYRKVVLTQEMLMDMVCFYLGGRIAEQVVLADTSTTALLDIEMATEIAQDMVEVYGMGIETNIVTNYRRIRNLKNSGQGKRSLSLRRQNLLDKEIQNILEKQYGRGEKLIMSNEETLRMLSAALLEKQTLGHVELKDFFEKHPLKEEIYP